MKLYLHINYQTKPGENLLINVLENDHIKSVFPLHYNEGGNWSTEIDFFDRVISYRYQVSDQTGSIIAEELSPHRLVFPHNYDEFRIHDFWNEKNFPENYLNNKILKNKWHKSAFRKVSVLKKHTHLLRLEAPVYNPDWQVIVMGNNEALGNWDEAHALVMTQTSAGIWELAVSLPDNGISHYKYGLYHAPTGKIVNLEYGENRWMLPNPTPDILHVQADHFYRFHAEEMFHAAGVAVPVFALRSKTGFGVGEFSDLKELADWAHQTKLSMIQILPINDTTANYSWTDSYPYAAISVYALHPQYLSVDALDYKLSENLRTEFEKERAELNALALVDYERMMGGKWKYVRQIFENNRTAILKDRNFRKFLDENASWLTPYVAFCVLRDKNKTPNFNEWKTHRKYIAGKILPFFSPKSKDYDETMLHAWVQYQLHLQLTDAIDYMHQLGISVKGDLPIGIYRYSVEAWTEPELFGMDYQAGAPPDQFSDLGQNWEFPTYNWEAMKNDGYRWWKNRFKALEQYFDAMRIDHILGFFRIWRMPATATQGILGYFYPAIPVSVEEFQARGLTFNYKRYCEPFINDEILIQYFGSEANRVKEQFLDEQDSGTFKFKPEFDTQRKLADFFAGQNEPLAQSLLALAANVLFLEEVTEEGISVYHPRFSIEKTASYQFLNDDEKRKLSDLYIDYFFKRQEGLWYRAAMEKLPVILNATDMLICGEDLGLVPQSVPLVMDRLGITALKVQRMPPGNELWYDPAQADYLNVVTASSHDSSTLRQWWQEDRAFTQQYFREQLHQLGTAPHELHPRLAEMILKQHLHTNAMLAIFPIQDFFATETELLNLAMNDERINEPAVFPHYWRYRMHVELEELIKNQKFNEKILNWVVDSNRV